MEKLTQELTSAEGFCKVINENAGEVKATMIREVELEDGTVVKVEGMTPEAIKNVLGVSFKTPGEPVQVYADASKIGPTETTIINGVAQIYNEAAPVEEEEVVPANFNVEVGKTYKVTLRETIDESIDLETQTARDLQIGNDDINVGLFMGCIAGYTSAIETEDGVMPLMITYTNEATLNKIKELYGRSSTVVDNSTSAIGWKNLVFNSDDTITIEDTEVPETLTLENISTITLDDNDTGVQSLDLAEFAWFFKSIEEVA